MSILTEEAFKNLYIPFIKQHENPKLYEDKPDAPLCYTETTNEKICIGYGYELNARKYNEAVAELTEAGFNLTKMGTGDKNFSQKLSDFYEDKSINYIELKQWIIENASVINLTKSTCDKLFEDIFPQYIKRLDDRINELIPSTVNNELYNLIKPGVYSNNTLITHGTYSNERGALLSLVYNNSALIGDGLANAIKNNNRAEAWYEIRYNTHGGKTANLPGLAERRVKESDAFRLYKTDNPTEAEARSAYIMFQTHKDKILKYETKWNNRIVEREKNGQKVKEKFNLFIASNGIQSQLSTTYNCLISRYASGNTTIAWDQIYVGDEGNNHIVQRGNGNCLIIADDGNDVITTGSGNDTLIGGTGNDVLNGGTGADTYEFNICDGYDFIKETGNDVNTIKINASISSFEIFRLNANEVILRSTSGGNHIRIQGSENFQVKFSDKETTLADMLQENDQVPADTEVCPPNQTPFYIPSTGKRFIYLPENFQGVLDLRNLSSGVEVFGIAEETYVLLPSGVRIETDATTGKIILKNQEQTVGTLTGCAGSSDNAGMFVIGTAFLCRLDATGQTQIKWIERLSELRQDVRFYLSRNKETTQNKRSPLAIDLDGDGVETVSVANGVHFDHDGNGFAEKSGWISADDAASLTVRVLGYDRGRGRLIIRDLLIWGAKQGDYTLAA